MLDNASRHALMSDKIFSEKNRMADDGTLAMALFYNLVCQSRHPSGLSSIDANNCYDRIVHAIALLVCQLFGVPQEVMVSMLRMIQEMEFFFCTAYQDSNTVVGLRVDIKMQGLCQGNSATPTGWAVVSINILCTHKRKGHGMKIVCPVSKLNGHVAAVLYDDDTDIIHLDLGKEETLEEAYARLLESVLSWGNLLIATGGSLKPSKSFYRLISFDFNEKGRWKYSNNHKRADLEIPIPQSDDTLAGIDHLSMNQAHKMLGSMTCPTGSGGAVIQQMWDKAQAWLFKAIDA